MANITWSTSEYKGIRIHQAHGHEDESELWEFRMDGLATDGIHEAWYAYSCYGYDGGGILIARRGDEYDYCSLGHCSCDAPLDGFRFSGTSLSDIEERAAGWLSEDEEFRAVLAKAKESGN